MYYQKKAFNLQIMYDLLIERKDVNARKLYNICWKIYQESKIADLKYVTVTYLVGNKQVCCKYPELPEIMKQTIALAICLIGRWFDDIHSGKPRMMERYYLTCKPVDFWHQAEIFKHDDMKCRNMEELIEKIIEK